LASESKSIKPKQQGCCGDLPVVLRRMIGTYYNTEGGWQSTLILNNKGPNPIAVTPILYSQAGQTFTGSAVSVGGQSSLDVDLNALARSAGPHFREGSFEFTYTGRILEVGGGLRIFDADKSLIFDEQMLEPGMKFPASQLESVFSIPYESAEATLIVTNTTTKFLTVNGQAMFTGTGIRLPLTYALAPHQSRAFTLPRGLASRARAGAISLKHDGEKGALLAIIHVEEERKGFSAAVNFSNYATGKTSTLHGAGLRLGNINGDALRPIVVARNTGENRTTITARVPYTKKDGTTGVINLPQLTLDPNEIDFIDTSNPQLRQPDIVTAGLEIEYTGQAGGVIASAYSGSASGNHVFVLPLKDPQIGLSSTGGYPWFIKGSSSTIVFIKNTTNEPQKFTLDIVYPGGKWGSDLKTIDPNQTFKLDVREVRDSQMKGSEGNAMPPDATAGHIAWSVRGKGRNKTLIGRAQTVDIANGLVSTYECQFCCPTNYYDSRMTPAIMVGFPDAAQQFLAQERRSDCHGNVTTWSGADYVVYSSDDYNIADISFGGLVTAIGEGSTILRGAWEDYTYFMDSERCEEQPVSAECTGDAVVLVPKTLSVVSITTLGTGSSGDYGCQPGQDYGIKINIKYQVKDQNGNDIRDNTMTPQEKVTNVKFNNVDQPDPVPDWSNIGPSRISGTSENTDSNGQFRDAPFGICGPGSFTYSFKQQISILMNNRRYTVKTHNLSASSSTSGQGTISNGSDVQKSRP
jgi:hypothetical protein